MRCPRRSSTVFQRAEQQHLGALDRRVRVGDAHADLVGGEIAVPVADRERVAEGDLVLEPDEHGVLLVDLGEQGGALLARARERADLDGASGRSRVRVRQTSLRPFGIGGRPVEPNRRCDLRLAELAHARRWRGVAFRRPLVAITAEPHAPRAAGAAVAVRRARTLRRASRTRARRRSRWIGVALVTAFAAADLGRRGRRALARGARARDRGARRHPRRRAVRERADAGLARTCPVLAELSSAGSTRSRGARGLQIAQVAAVAIAVLACSRSTRAGSVPATARPLVVLLAVIPAAFAAIVAIRAQLFSLALFPLLAAAAARRGAPALAPDLARPAAARALVEPARRGADRASPSPAPTCSSTARGASRSSPLGVLRRLAGRRSA